jgi:hypothetical protein
LAFFVQNRCRFLKTIICEPVVAKSSSFAKTGSGQAQHKHKHKRKSIVVSNGVSSLMRSLQNWDSLWQNDGLASDPKVSFVGIQVRICPLSSFKGAAEIQNTEWNVPFDKMSKQSAIFLLVALMNMISLPRQARDKRNKSTTKNHFCAFSLSIGTQAGARQIPPLPRRRAHRNAGAAHRADLIVQAAVGARCEKTVSFFEFSLCLSRACLGKMIVFIYKWLKNAGFRREGRRQPDYPG